ncbi:MAG: Ig-like domain-containing protein [Actinomycetota bacterium]|nr:Ig-like domain-containing protein [Actinomycetota bacterium]
MGYRVRSLVVASVLAVVGVLLPAVAVHAVQVPETLSYRSSVGAGPVEPGFSVDHVGVLWDVSGHEGHGHEPDGHGAVRFRHDGVWGGWIPLIEDGADGDGLWASGLVAGGGAEAFQLRGLPAHAGSPRVVALNTTVGPLRTVRIRAGGAAAVDNCLSRAEWGAEESLRFDADGNEVWPPEFYDAQVMTVHHTATDNDDPDPAATVRAIYEYHAVDKGWGDIGYQYLIDEQGRVYEGRWSGAASQPCADGGTGADFAHESTVDDARMVTGAHTGGWNSGNLGVALLGDFRDHPHFGAEPKQAAVDAAEWVLAELAGRHGIDPQSTVTYVNPVSGDTKVVDAIAGHRDYTATECPGERLYEDLPEIRAAVAALLPTVAVALTAPADGATVSGTVELAADASADAGVSQVDFTVDGTAVGSDTDGTDGWAAVWDSTTAGDGSAAIEATATDSDGNTATDRITVDVDNVDDPPQATITDPADGTTVAGTVTITADAVDDDGVTQLDFIVDGALLHTDTDGGDGWTAVWDTTGLVDGSTHTIDATATDTAGQTGQATQISVTVDNATPATMHVGDLDGASSSQGRTWTAHVTILVVAADGNPVDGAAVSGSWTGSSSGDTTSNCTTDTSGICTIELAGIHKHDGSVDLTVTDISHTRLDYDPTANTDPDGDSDGTTITVTKP